jgi:DNA-binding SARP family transcriptional activator/Flp pilus assembly protein TadD
MWFGILGPLLVDDGNSVVAPPAARQRVLMAALLVQAGHTVPADTLAELVWDGAPPAGAAITLRSHVMRLRRVLGPKAASRVVTCYPGYLVEADEQEVDLLRFTRLYREGAAAAAVGAWQQASETLGEALGLWRGEPLADVPSQVLAVREVPRLAQLRLEALEACIGADLHLGRHAKVIPELRQLAVAHPLRERLYSLLMLALYRDGRQAEALAVYQQAREVLIEELGTEPGTELREMHQQILTANPTLELAGPRRLAAAAVPVTPRELPAEVLHFTGRAMELAMLNRLVERPGAQAPAGIIVSAIGGTAGVGKTALTVHWAHQVAGRFSDGQLYVNLRGYDLGHPMSAADALAGFLRSLGLPGEDIPASEEERARRYRSLLAERRMLVILDNARSAEQVRPLLPATPACVVVVTSRDSLPGLVARDGVTRLDLDLLPEEDAVSLLRALLGSRADAEPEAVRALADRCCRLPLALRVAAELAAVRPAALLTDLVGELADHQRRLDLLDAGGDPQTAVRTVFSWSYRQLDTEVARAFRLAGLHPGPDLDPYAVAALTSTTLQLARHMLELLARAYLIQPAQPGRYRMHDLLRGYACQLAVAEDGREERHVALTSLLDHYLHTAAVAMDALFPAESHRRPSIRPSSGPAPSVADLGTARAWLDAERSTLVAVALFAAEHGWPGHATLLAAILFRYLEGGGHSPEAVAIHSCASRAAHQVGDQAAEATALTNLGLADWRQGRYQQAADHFENALALFRAVGDWAGETRALGNLGLVDSQQGRYQVAATHFRQVLVLCRQAGDQAGETRALVNLGLADLRRSCHQQAGDHFRQALTLSRQNGDRTAQAYALSNLGALDMREGRYQQAADHHQQALALFREIGDRPGEANTLNGLGELLLATGRPGDSRIRHIMALSVASPTGERYEQARAHDGLASACHAAGDHSQARRHWQQALALYAGLGAPQVERIRSRLAAYDGDPRTPCA